MQCIYMTVLLTDSIDFSQFFGKDISPKVTAVCVVFTVSTILYFVATIIMCNQKFDWLNQLYIVFKANYNRVFDNKDIKETFNHDLPLNTVETQDKIIRLKIGIIWGILIATMVFLMVFCFLKERM